MDTSPYTPCGGAKTPTMPQIDAASFQLKDQNGPTFPECCVSTCARPVTDWAPLWQRCSRLSTPGACSFSDVRMPLCSTPRARAESDGGASAGPIASGSEAASSAVPDADVQEDEHGAANEDDDSTADSLEGSIETERVSLFTFLKTPLVRKLPRCASGSSPRWLAYQPACVSQRPFTARALSHMHACNRCTSMHAVRTTVQSYLDQSLKLFKAHAGALVCSVGK